MSHRPGSSQVAKAHHFSWVPLTHPDVYFLKIPLKLQLELQVMGGAIHICVDASPIPTVTIYVTICHHVRLIPDENPCCWNGFTTVASCLVVNPFQFCVWLKSRVLRIVGEPVKNRHLHSACWNTPIITYLPSFTIIYIIIYIYIILMCIYIVVYSYIYIYRPLIHQTWWATSHFGNSKCRGKGCLLHPQVLRGWCGEQRPGRCGLRQRGGRRVGELVMPRLSGSTWVWYGDLLQTHYVEDHP